MRIQRYFILGIALCGLSMPAQAATALPDQDVPAVSPQQMRVGVVTGFRALYERACQHLCGVGKADCVTKCLHESVPPEVLTLQAIVQDGDDDALRCIKAGGFLIERMPACSDSIEVLMRLGGRQDDMGAMLAAIAAFGDHCSADVLCEGRDAPAGDNDD